MTFSIASGFRIPDAPNSVVYRKYGNMGHIKTTIDIPDALFRKAKSHAAENGQSLKDFVAETLQSSLAAATTGAASAEPKWMAGFGQLRRLKKGTGRIQGLIDEAFEVVEVEDSR